MYGVKFFRHFTRSRAVNASITGNLDKHPVENIGPNGVMTIGHGRFRAIACACTRLTSGLMRRGPDHFRGGFEAKDIAQGAKMLFAHRFEGMAHI